jgi:hypothetical protein
MPVPLAVLALAAGSGLLLAGFAMASNWHSWADRYAGWFKSNFGFLAFGTSPISMRVLGLIWIAIGAVVLVVTVMQFAARGRL